MPGQAVLRAYYLKIVEMSGYNVPKSNLVQKTKKYIQSYGLITANKIIIVGVSGGADSVALIRVLHSIQYELGIQLHIAHYNHGLRRGALTDQKFVENLAVKLNLPCTTELWKNPCSIKKGSLEEEARKHRFDFFMRVATSNKTDTIALAHTKDDLAETVLMRILRGTGLQGIRSILPKRKILEFLFIRPFLERGREEIECYLKKENAPFRTDPTNKQIKFFRNKIRIEILPYLEKKYNKKIKDALANLSDNISTDYDYLKLQATKNFTKSAIIAEKGAEILFNINLFGKQHPALRRMIIRMAIQRLKGNTNRLTLRHIKEIDSLVQNRPAGSIVHLPDGIHINKTLTELKISRKPE